MNIFINDKPAEIILEAEKNLGDVMSGIEQWLLPSGNRIKKICINGKEASGEDLPEVFGMAVQDIEKLDVFVSAWRELAAEALGVLYETCMVFKESPFDERSNISADWETSSAAHFLKTDIPDIYDLVRQSLLGEGLSQADLLIILGERLSEITDPWQEISRSESQVNIVAKRLEEFPLDMQIGKDNRAAETIQLFSQLSEKLFRVFFIYKSEGLSTETLAIEGLPVKALIEEFNATLRELSQAYENRDLVLAGDIVEYEIAPRFLKFFTALKNIPESDSPVLTTS
jgi:hypothetical protein